MEPKLPDHLHAAYNWIDAAGEWGEAIADPGYARDAALNAAEHDQPITESDLRAAIEWYSANR